ncbi:DegT/DnrJ/EryC1/StrS aminotransferase family protein [Gammaproteobacteria bacterium]|nr:DegT/DnrJ/EryC1/StrS aminotransferase family protein [Gammaproteobacteria bacterium]
MKERIPYTLPSITDLEVAFATDAAKNGWGECCYQYIERFEQLFKDHLETQYAIATSSCTGALHMGLAAIGVGPGDEVILADANWIATAAPIIHLGATPIVVDILSDTWCVDPQAVESAITKRTKAIIAVHLYGNLCDMDELLRLGDKYGIPIVEDAAEAIGSVYRDRRAGSIGKFGVFSFHGSKTLTTGEGGMFVTNDRALFKNVLTLSNHGRARGEVKQFWPDRVGFKYRMSNIEAAIGCAQMERAFELISRKRDILEYYKKHLETLPGLTMNSEPDGTIIGAWMPTVVFSIETGVSRDLLLSRFAQEEIDARVFFWPLSSLGLFTAEYDNKIARDISSRAINLPSYHDISEGDMDRIISIIRSIHNR